MLHHKRCGVTVAVELSLVKSSASILFYHPTRYFTTTYPVSVLGASRVLRRAAMVQYTMLVVESRYTNITLSLVYYSQVRQSPGRVLAVPPMHCCIMEAKIGEIVENRSSGGFKDKDQPRQIWATK